MLLSQAIEGLSSVASPGIARQMRITSFNIIHGDARYVLKRLSKFVCRDSDSCLEVMISRDSEFEKLSVLLCGYSLGNSHEDERNWSNPMPLL